MDKTLTEIRESKSKLEDEIATLLLKFEKENDIKVTSCYVFNYEKELDKLNISSVESEKIPTTHNIKFQINVSL